MLTALIAAGVIATGAVVGSVVSAKSQEKANEKNIAMQQQTNDTSIELANTAHQREVYDLQKAGLNPVLSVNGSGSATPTLGTAQVQPEYKDLGNTIANSANSMANMISSVGNSQQALSQANLNEVNAKIQPEVAKAEIASKFAQAGSAKAQADYTEVMKDVDKALKSAETQSQEWENNMNKELGTSKNENGIYRGFKNAVRSLVDTKYNPLMRHSARSL